MKLFDTSGPGFLVCVQSAWRTGGREFFFHNLSCQLRRGRYKDCYFYRDTWYDNVLFSLGVFIMDPLGSYQKARFEHYASYKAEYGSENEQYERHPLPWVRDRARKLKQRIQERELNKVNTDAS